jgi:hypothetical protein
MMYSRDKQEKFRYIYVTVILSNTVFYKMPRQTVELLKNTKFFILPRGYQAK